MNQGITPIFFALLRSAILSTKLTEAECEILSSEMRQELFLLAQKHDISHLIAYALKKNAMVTDKDHEVEGAISKAVYRYAQLKHEYHRVCDKLESEEISFMPLKGAILREYYPQPWMRTSCDIDILLHEEDLEKTADIFMKEGGTIPWGKGSHDISIFTPNHTHLEFHYTLVEEGLACEAAGVLNNVWANAAICNGFYKKYEMSEEMFYFYHIAHMAKHFELGGCGIRSFLDLWILDQRESADPEKRDALLERGKLLKFAKAARKLSRVWFEGEEMDQVSRQMEEYVIRGGVYGSSENRITMQQQKKGGRLKYAVSKIFLPYEVLIFHYPVLQKHRWLMPVMEVRRWGRLLFCGHAKRVTRELAYNQRISKGTADDAQNFLKSIGL